MRGATLDLISGGVRTSDTKSSLEEEGPHLVMRGLMAPTFDLGNIEGVEVSSSTL